MQPHFYKGYEVWGHAIPNDERFDASGTITSGRKLIEGSGILATCETEEEARAFGISWATAWVDTHG
ncbi:hypothetical protein ABH945_003721 [Paraburkholderia sp. GAS333]